MYNENGDQKRRSKIKYILGAAVVKTGRGSKPRGGDCAPLIPKATRATSKVSSLQKNIKLTGDRLEEGTRTPGGGPYINGAPGGIM